MQTSTRFPLLLILLAATDVARAEEEFNPAVRAAAIAPFIDSQTISIGHVDLARVEVDPLVDTVIKLLPDATFVAQRVRGKLTGLHSVFRQAGFRDLYVVVSLADVPEKPPFVIVPVTGNPNVPALLEQLSQLQTFSRDSRVRRVKGAVFFGDGRTLARLERLQADQRRELAAAFEAAGDTAAQLLLLPTDRDRRVIEETLPRLPEAMGGGPSTIVTHGLVWASVGANPTPEASLRLVIQSRDPTAAAALRVKWTDTIQRIGGREDALLREFGNAAALLTPQVDGSRLTLRIDRRSGSAAALWAALVLPSEKALERIHRKQSVRNLKQIALAMHNWHDVHKSFPAQGNYDASGRPLLSWRVHVLRFVEERKLYEQFRLDEPWDSDHNRKLIEKMPDLYSSPASRISETGRASYLFPVGPQTVCSGSSGIKLREITDGSSNTILVVEVDDEHTVIWTKPEDLLLDPADPARGLGGLYEGGFNTALCDGSALFIALPQDPKKLRAAFTRNGGEALFPD